MKKLYLFLLIAVLTSCSMYTDYDIWSIDDSQTKSNDKEHIYNTVLRSIDYKQDGCKWSFPQETIDNNTGDCIDRVLLMIAIYYKNTGIKTSIAADSGGL